MTRKQRAFVYEGIAIGAAGFFGVFTIPNLISSQDSFTVIGGAFLLIGWFAWIAYFFYRILKEAK